MKLPLWTCVAIGGGCGLLGLIGGLAMTEEGRELFGGIFGSEIDADVANPKGISTEFYQLEYPGNWALDESDPDLDLENYISIDSPGENFITITFAHYESDLEEDLETYSDEYRELMRRPKVSGFSEYGAYTGKGNRIQGKIYGLGCTVDVFCGFENGVTFTIVEWVFDEDSADVTPGFDLIESSFKLEEEVGQAKQEDTACPEVPRTVTVLESDG